VGIDGAAHRRRRDVSEDLDLVARLVPGLAASVAQHQRAIGRVRFDSTELGERHHRSDRGGRGPRVDRIGEHVAQPFLVRRGRDVDLERLDFTIGVGEQLLDPLDGCFQGALLGDQSVAQPPGRHARQRQRDGHQTRGDALHGRQSYRARRGIV